MVPLLCIAEQRAVSRRRQNGRPEPHPPGDLPWLRAAAGRPDVRTRPLPGEPDPEAAIARVPHRLQAGASGTAGRPVPVEGEHRLLELAGVGRGGAGPVLGEVRHRLLVGLDTAVEEAANGARSRYVVVTVAEGHGSQCTFWRGDVLVQEGPLAVVLLETVLGLLCMVTRPFHHTQVDYARWCILLTWPKEPTLIKKKISQIAPSLAPGPSKI